MNAKTDMTTRRNFAYEARSEVKAGRQAVSERPALKLKTHIKAGTECYDDYVVRKRPGSTKSR